MMKRLARFGGVVDRCFAGGLLARCGRRPVLYTGTYTCPKDVSGLVLVGALNEALQDAPTPKQWVIQRRLIQNDDPESLALYDATVLVRVQPNVEAIVAPPPQTSAGKSCTRSCKINHSHQLEANQSRTGSDSPRQVASSAADDPWACSGPANDRAW